MTLSPEMIAELTQEVISRIYAELGQAPARAAAPW